eukprot:SAG22_NODE_2951_length_2081_cov_1.848638_2_plen_296_part_00
MDVLSFLTPPKVVLSVLLKLYTEHSADMGSASDQWLQLVLFLVEEVKSADNCYEKSLDEMLKDIHNLDCDASEVAGHLENQLGEFQSPDDLFNFLSDLGVLGSDTDDQTLEPNSVLGVFARKVDLSFQSMPFERFCALYDRTVLYVKTSQLALALDSSALSSISVDEEAGPVALSVDQLQAHVHREAQILEESAQPCDLASLGQSIDEMMPYAPQVPQIIYLRFLHCIRVRDFERAVDSLHRYFDLYATKGGACGTQSRAQLGTLSLSPPCIPSHRVAGLRLGPHMQASASSTPS